MIITGPVRVVRISGLKTYETKGKTGTVVNFTVVHNEVVKGKPRATYYDCALFDRDAERIIKAKVKTGSLLHVSGTFRIEEFTREDNTKGQSLTIADINWSFLPSFSKKDSDEESEAPQAEVEESTAVAGPEEEAESSDDSNDIDLDDIEMPF